MYGVSFLCRALDVCGRNGDGISGTFNQSSNEGAWNSSDVQDNIVIIHGDNVFDVADNS